MHMTPTGQFETDNRFPGCVFIELSTQPTHSEIDLVIDINFGLQEIITPAGKVDFAIKRGQLSLSLFDSKMPLGKVKLAPCLESVTELEREKEHSQEIGLSTSGVVLGVKGQGHNKETTKSTEKCYVYSYRASEENPIWDFKSEPKPYLKGKLSECLGTLEKEAETCEVEATFFIRHQRDIEPLESFGLLSCEKLSGNRTAVLARKFFLRYIEKELMPYLSKIEGKL